MARIVAGLGVPHHPENPSTIARRDPEDETAKLYACLEDLLDQARPDVLLMFDCDHMNAFFDTVPQLAIGVAAQTSGPNDATPSVAPTTIPVPEALAGHVRDACIEDGFDVALSRCFTVDHSILVPLHYLRPAHDLPVLPVFINGLLPPVPDAGRCAALGHAVREAVAAWPDELRVAILASGSLSLEVGGPRVAPGSIFGEPDRTWAARAVQLLAAGDLDALTAEATRDQMAAAGNVGGEVLNWIAMLAAIGSTPATTAQVGPRAGDGYGFWTVEP